MILVPVFLTCSGIQYAFFAYYTYLTRHTLKGVDNATMLYSNTISHLIPATLYIVLLINLYTGSTLEQIVSYYPLEWMITTPLLLVTLSSIKLASFTTYYIISFLMMLTSMMGYISLRFKETGSHMIPYIAFSIGGVFYITILCVLTYIHFYTNNVTENASQYNDLNRNKIYKTLLFLVLGSWTLYPVVCITYIMSYIDVETCIAIFTFTDILSKSVFTTIVMGYELYKNKNKSLLSRMTTRIAQIHPLTFPSMAVEPGQASYTLSDVPQVTHTAATMATMV